MAIDRRKKTMRSEPAIRRTFRENLRNRRLERGLSQQRLGEQLGVTQQWIHQLESATSDNVPSVYQLDELASCLDTAPSELLTPGRFRGKNKPDKKHI